MRQDPPFDMAYITTTHILERLPASTMVVNNPAEVRNAPEKLLVTHYPDLLPATLIVTTMQFTNFGLNTEILSSNRSLQWWGWGFSYSAK